MSQTRLLGRIDLDGDRLGEDMSRADRFRYSDTYSEFTCGSWKGSALCNSTGDLYDTRLIDYEGRYRVTEHGRQMPYALDLIEKHFQTDKMRYARLGRITPGSVMVPHRDYLELDEPLVRIHIPLHTSKSCFSSEDDTIYQMKLGDVWFIDASHAHAAVSFWDEDRTHLIIDFISDTVEGALRFTPDPVDPDDQFAGAGVAREPLSDAHREALLGLSDVIGPHNYRDILALVIKQYFVADLSVPAIFDLACEIARKGDQEEALEKLTWLRTHALVQRLD